MLCGAVVSCFKGLREVHRTSFFWTFKNNVKYIWGCKHFHARIQKQNIFAIKSASQRAKNIVDFHSLSKYGTTSFLPQHQHVEDQISSNNGSEEQVEIFCQKNGIIVHGKNSPKPFLSISEAGFPEFINQVLKNNLIENPSPIQSMSWSVALQGRDLVGISPTGSGKTLGYVLPAVCHILKKNDEERNSWDENSKGPIALIIAPTRELVQQIQEVVQWFSNKLRCAAVYGGTSKHSQVKRLASGVEICVATPGRLYDLLTSHETDLNRCSYVVLDEADRMLDMGFLPQIQSIFKVMKKEKQVLMWSATWPEEVQDIAHDFLSNYIFISIGPTKLTANRNITQVIKICTWQSKREELLKFLKELDPESDYKILIFVQRKIHVDSLARYLKLNRIKSSFIHGDKSQEFRNKNMNSFRMGHTKIMIATDIAARGIDVENITHVINYDCPTDAASYIHRIGRTGRYHSTGKAITYVTQEDAVYSKYLITVLTECNQEVPEQLKNLIRNSKQKVIRKKYEKDREFPNKFKFQRSRPYRNIKRYVEEE